MCAVNMMLPADTHLLYNILYNYGRYKCQFQTNVDVSLEEKKYSKTNI